MITKLNLHSFKCFPQQHFSLGNINLFAGANGSGKSSVMQSILCLRQSWESKVLIEKTLRLNGRLVELGTVKDVFCVNSSNDDFGISLSWNDECSFTATTHYENSIHTHYDFSFAGSPSPELPSSLNLFSDCFNYLQAERIGPRKVGQVALDRAHPFDVGKGGENADFILASITKETTISNGHLILERGDVETLPLLKFQYVFWMQAFFPGFEVQSEIDFSADYVRTAISLGSVIGTKRPFFVRPPNTAFGISYVKAIVVAGLLAQKDSVLLVENPEAHLHPAGQSRIGEFLARVAAGGVQVFIETHSEHVLNGARRMIKQEIVPPNEFAVFFFSRDTAGDISSEKLNLDAAGEITKWPPGFFDQLDQDLQALYI